MRVCGLPMCLVFTFLLLLPRTPGEVQCGTGACQLGVTRLLHAFEGCSCDRRGCLCAGCV